MEIKAQLNKPYTDKQRIDFIVTYNHQQGYEIKETTTALEAWGLDSDELLTQAKTMKLGENETVREQFLISGVEYKDILWDSDIEQKLNISIQVSQTSDEDTIDWVAMDGITSLECTKEDLLNIGALLTQMTAYVWQYKNPTIKTMINNAQTIEEVNAIQIIYDMNEIVPPEPEPQPVDDDSDSDTDVDTDTDIDTDTDLDTDSDSDTDNDSEIK